MISLGSPRWLQATGKVILTDMSLDDKFVVFECTCAKVTVVLIVVVERLAHKVLKRSIPYVASIGNA